MPCPKVLVVDDSRTVRTIVSRCLTSAGYEVTCATDGQEGISLLDSVCPQLIVLDIEMPVMDGYHVCQALQELGPPWSTLPIIFLTSTCNHALELLGTQMGAYIRKPVCEDLLLETVSQILDARPSQAEETTTVS